MKTIFFGICLIAAVLVGFIISARANYATPAQVEVVPSGGGEKLLRCEKNHGRVALEEVQIPSLQTVFPRAGMPPVLVTPLLREASKQAGCLSLVEEGTPHVRMKLVVEQSPPKVDVEANENGSVSHFLEWFMSDHERAKINKQMYLSDMLVSMTVIDLETGEPVAFVIGEGRSSDTRLGKELVANSSGALRDMQYQNTSFHVVATEFADAFNKLVPLMDKMNQKLPRQNTNKQEKQ